MREDEIIAHLMRKKILTTKEYAECAKDAMAWGSSLLQTAYEKGYVTREQLEALGYPVGYLEKRKVSVGGFEIVEELSHGAMGKIYKAVQPSLGRTVALKVLPKSLARDDAYVERFLREARAAAALNHPNIVTVIDCGADGDTYYMVMEYIEGESLRDMINRRGKIPEKEALKYTYDIAEALDAANRAGIVHRDVKPANIIITPDGTAKLCDLGLAKKRSGDVALTQPGQVMGSPQYMPPEQIERPADADTRSDVYSLGITLFHMLTGRLPYEGGNIFEIMEKQLHEPVPPVGKFAPEVSQHTARLVRRMVEKNPERRHRNPRELIEDIKRVKKGWAPSKAPPRAAKAAVAKPAGAHAAPARPALREVAAKRSGVPVGPILAGLVLVIGLVMVVSLISKSNGRRRNIRTGGGTGGGRTTTPSDPQDIPDIMNPPGQGPAIKTPLVDNAQRYAPAVQRILKSYAFERRKALTALRRLAAESKVTEERQQAAELVEKLSGPLVLEVKEALEKATTLEEYATVLKAAEEVAGYVARTKHAAALQEVKAEALTRFSRALDGEAGEVRRLVAAHKFDDARRKAQALAAVPHARRLARTLLDEVERERKRFAEQQRKGREEQAEASRKGIKEALRRLDITAAREHLESGRDVLPAEQAAFFDGLMMAAERVLQAASATLSRSVGRRLSIKLADGSTAADVVSSFSEGKLVIGGRTLTWGDMAIGEWVELALRASGGDARLYAASLSLMAFLGADPRAMAEVWSKAPRHQISLPQSVTEQIASAVLEDELRECESRLKSKPVEAGERLSAAAAPFSATRVMARFKPRIDALLERCIKKARLTKAFLGKVSFHNGFVRVVYDFQDPGQFGDFEFYPQTPEEKKRPGCSWRAGGGALAGEGHGVLRWKPVLRGDLRVSASVQVQSEEYKNVGFRLCDNGKGKRGSYIWLVFAFAHWREKTVGMGRDGKPIKTWEKTGESHRIGAYYGSPRRAPVLSPDVGEPKIVKGRTYEILIERLGESVSASINGRRILDAEEKRLTSGNFCLRVDHSDIRYRRLTIDCHLDFSWLRKATR